MRLRITLALLPLLLLAACGGGNQGGGKPASRAFPVQVEEIKGQRVEYVVSAIGALEAFEEVLITARVSGVVEKVLFREGQVVGPQDVLVEIEPARFQYAHDAATSAHAQAVAEVSELKTGLDSRTTANERAREAKRTEPFSANEIQAWESRYAAALANEAVKKAEASQAGLDLEFARLRSPIAGEIQERNVQTGQWVQPGTVITRLVNTEKPMLVRFNVASDEASAVKRDQAATFTLIGSGRVYNAKITYIAVSADTLTRMVQCVAELTDPREDTIALKPGDAVRVTVPVGARDDAPTVPETAVRPSERGFLVYVVEGKQAVERVIEIGLRTPDGRIEVRSGLKPGEKVVIRGADALRNGVEVNVGGATGGAKSGSPRGPAQ